MLPELRIVEKKPPELMLGLLQETQQGQCLELLREHQQLVLRLLRGPTSNLGWSTMCLVLGPLDAATSRGYKWQGCCWWHTGLSWKLSHFFLPLNFLFSPLSPIGQLEATRCLEKIVCRLPALASQSRNEGAGEWGTQEINCLKGFCYALFHCLPKTLYQLTLPLAGHGNV